MLRKYWQSFINNWKENLYLFSLTVFLIALPTSVALISFTSATLLIVWLLTGDIKTKWNRLIHNRSALLMLSIPLLYLVGLCFTQNFALGIQEFNKSIYWFIFAFVLGSSAPLSQKITLKLLSIYILLVAVAAGAALLKLFFIDSIHFFDFRSVTWIDHIPFSYQIAFVIWVLFYFILKKNFSFFQNSLLVLLIVFLIITLFSLKSFSAYLYFGVMSATACIMLIKETKRKTNKLLFGGGLIVIIVVPIFYVYSCVQKFYNITEYPADEVPLYTSNGHKYQHNFDDKSKENGNYSSLFVCEEELIPLWNTHSKRKYDSKTSAGYPLSSVIKRYMTSKGLRKDAEGFAQLTSQDIKNIENEIPNYIYAENKLSIYPRIYETIWELDLYKITHNPNGKSSAQRIEQAILSFNIIKKNIWCGIGLGNNAKAYDLAILELNSKLTSQQTGSSHNQYLNYLIRFGVLGTLYILGVLFWIFFHDRKNNTFLITIFFVSMLMANFGEANWETFIGLNFFAFFMCFLMWTTPKNIFENHAL